MSEPIQLPAIVIFEGPDGSGKSTQLDKTSFLLLEEGIEHVIAKNPGSTPLGKLIRKEALAADSPMSQPARLQAMLLALVDVGERIVIPAIKAGKWVLLDRWSLSTLIYQGFLADGLPAHQVASAVGAALAHLPVPSQIIVYDVDAAVAWKRKEDRDQPYSIFETEYDTCRQICAGYTLSRALTPLPLAMIDGNDTIDKVWDATKPIIERLIQISRESVPRPNTDTELAEAVDKND